MSEEVLKVANGPVMWIISLVIVSIVVVQAVLFYRATKKYALEGEYLTDAEIKGCLKSGGLTAIGPAVSVFIMGLTMVSLLGGPVTLMRIGIIGAPQTEMAAANVGTLLAGVNLGTDKLTLPAYGNAMFACALMSTGYLIMVPIFGRGLGKPLAKLFAPPKEGAKPKLLSVILTMVLPLAMVVLLAVSQLSAGMASFAVMIVAAVLMIVLNKLATNPKLSWLKEWGMGIAVLVSMFVGPTLASIF